MSRDQLDTLFKQYEESFNSFNAKALTDYCADTFMAVSPKGTTSKNKKEYAEKTAEAVKFYQGLGRDSAKIMSRRIIPICDKYTMIVIRWGLTFKKTGRTLLEFDKSYIVYDDGSDPKIILVISHDDEETAFRKLQLST